MKRLLAVLAGVILAAGFFFSLWITGADRPPVPPSALVVCFAGYTNGFDGTRVPSLITQIPDNAQRVQTWHANRARQGVFTYRNITPYTVSLSGECFVRALDEKGEPEDVPTTYYSAPGLEARPGETITFRTAIFSKPSRWRLETTGFYVPVAPSQAGQLSAWTRMAFRWLMSRSPMSLEVQAMELRTEWITETAANTPLP